jgi:hypothetical protein
MSPQNESPGATPGLVVEDAFLSRKHPDDAPKIQVSQAENIASSITCASMRATALRAGLVREILRAAAIGMQAQAALLDEDDGAALAHLREHWLVTRSAIAPMAAELRQLAGDGR